MISIIVHNCHTQHSTETFWLSALLSSIQTPKLRCCLLGWKGAILLGVYWRKILVPYRRCAWNQTRRRQTATDMHYYLVAGAFVSQVSNRHVEEQASA